MAVVLLKEWELLTEANVQKCVNSIKEKVKHYI
jgi:hypothetical protein